MTYFIANYFRQCLIFCAKFSEMSQFAKMAIASANPATYLILFSRSTISSLSPFSSSSKSVFILPRNILLILPGLPPSFLEMISNDLSFLALCRSFKPLKDRKCVCQSTICKNMFIVLHDHDDLHHKVYVHFSIQNSPLPGSPHSFLEIISISKDLSLFTLKRESKGMSTVFSVSQLNYDVKLNNLNHLKAFSMGCTGIILSNSEVGTPSLETNTRNSFHTVLYF